MSIYDLVLRGYYTSRLRRPPDPARYVLAQPGWLARGARALDYGGGKGRWATRLARQARLVVVADIDEQALRRVPLHRQVRPVLIDGVTLPFRSAAFDLIFVNHVFHHVEDLVSVLAELVRVVRPGGRLVIVEFDPGASVTRIYRFLSRYRMHPCAFYAPRTLADLLGGQGLTAHEERLDDFQYALVVSHRSDDQQRDFHERSL